MTWIAGMNFETFAFRRAAERSLRHSSLAKGVENAAIVCCFISLDYVESDDCQLGLQYAHKRGKRVIVLMLCRTQSWKPSDYLQSIMKDLERLECYDDCDLEIDFIAA